MMELTDDALRIKPGAQKIQLAGSLTEGTYIYKRDGYYYLFGSAGSCCEGANSTYRVVVARSTNLAGPYVNKKRRPRARQPVRDDTRGRRLRSRPGAQRRVHRRRQRRYVDDIPRLRPRPRQRRTYGVPRQGAMERRMALLRERPRFAHERCTLLQGPAITLRHTGGYERQRRPAATICKPRDFRAEAPRFCLQPTSNLPFSGAEK